MVKVKPILKGSLVVLLLTILNSGSAHALPGFIDSVFDGLFSTMPPDYAQRGLLALAAYFMIWSGLSVVLKKADQKRFSGPKVGISIVLAIITGIGIPQPFLDVIFGSVSGGMWGSIFSLVVILFPIAFLAYIGYRMPKNTFGKVIFAFLIMVATGMLQGFKKNDSFSGFISKDMPFIGMPIAEIVDILTLILMLSMVFVLLSLVFKLGSGTGESGKGRKLWSFKREHDSEELPHEEMSIEQWFKRIEQIDLVLVRQIQAFRHKATIDPSGNVKSYRKFRRNCKKLKKSDSKHLGYALKSEKSFFRNINKIAQEHPELLGSLPKMNRFMKQLHDAFFNTNHGDLGDYADYVANNKSDTLLLKNFAVSLVRFQSILVSFIEEYRPNQRRIHLYLEQERSKKETGQAHQESSLVNSSAAATLDSDRALEQRETKTGSESSDIENQVRQAEADAPEELISDLEEVQKTAREVEELVKEAHNDTMRSETDAVKAEQDEEKAGHEQGDQAIADADKGEQEEEQAENAEERASEEEDKAEKKLMQLREQLNHIDKKGLEKVKKMLDSYYPNLKHMLQLCENGKVQDPHDFLRLGAQRPETWSNNDKAFSKALKFLDDFKPQNDKMRNLIKYLDALRNEFYSGQPLLFDTLTDLFGEIGTAMRREGISWQKKEPYNNFLKYERPDLANRLDAFIPKLKRWNDLAAYIRSIMQDTEKTL